MKALLKTDELLEWFNCKQPAKLVRLMRDRNIHFHLDALGRPITTIDAINGSLEHTDNSDKIEF